MNLIEAWKEQRYSCCPLSEFELGFKIKLHVNPFEGLMKGKEMKERWMTVGLAMDSAGEENRED